MINNKKVLKVRKYKVGYKIRDELLTGDEACGLENFVMKSAYSPDGHYIGSTKDAHRLVVKRGIKPEPMPASCVGSPLAGLHICSIGFCEREQKWFGWSHRAIHGFRIGDKVKKGDCTNSPGCIDEYIREHPEADLSLPAGFEARNLDDCKRMAIAFSDSVS